MVACEVLNLPSFPLGAGLRVFFGSLALESTAELSLTLLAFALVLEPLSLLELRLFGFVVMLWITPSNCLIYHNQYTRAVEGVNPATKVLTVDNSKITI